MRFLSRVVSCSAFVFAVCNPFATYAAADTSDADALNLESAPVAAPEVGRPDTRIFVEGALGNSSQRYLQHSRDLERASFDFSHTTRLGMGLRAVFSDRLDVIHPTSGGSGGGAVAGGSSDSTVNSLREAYISWQAEGGNTIAEVGRINLRYGPAYGYNPTDFFRDGSLRTLTTANPFALRENRLGTVMIRGQRLWSGGSLSVAYSPKLADRPNLSGWSLDLGSTNNRDRILVALGTQFSPSVSSQLLAYKQDGLPTTLGASVTALLSDAATAHAEWSRGREPDLLGRTLGLTAPIATRNRFAGGATYTTLGKLSVTAEYEYNGFALSQKSWANLGANSPATQVRYSIKAQRLQEQVPRQAVLIYVTQKSLGLKDLDLTAFLRVNVGDRSRLAWVELRHHWSNFDLAFQLQQHMGRFNSEYGILPDRRIVQVLGTYYF